MSNKRFSLDQIAGILQQGDAGTPVSTLCRKQGISTSRYYRWRKVYGVKRTPPTELAQLREENARLKRLVAELARDTSMLRDALER